VIYSVDIDDASLFSEGSSVSKDTLSEDVGSYSILHWDRRGDIDFFSILKQPEKVGITHINLVHGVHLGKDELLEVSSYRQRKRCAGGTREIQDWYIPEAV